jgi:hypothetical protein
MANAKAKTFTVQRAARKGRPVDPTTLAARDTLSKRWGNKGDRNEVVEVGPDKKEIRRYSALVITRSDVGKPATYTGMPTLIGDWAEANGLKGKIRVSDLDGTHFAIALRDQG